MVKVKITKIESIEKGYKIFFDYFGKCKYALVSEINYNRLNNLNPNLELQPGLAVNVTRLIKESYRSDAIVELFRISKLIGIENE